MAITSKLSPSEITHLLHHVETGERTIRFEIHKKHVTFAAIFATVEVLAHLFEFSNVVLLLTLTAFVKDVVEGIEKIVD